ncbi:GNAT family N-acetyltransferase [uncultured Sphingomonas sp.]|uniref:GNAT family N-acetyltransferase n=1 Tax=uncultured Sphingomonas sp. TaxID=158754 RepID=UPI0025CF33BF|nr:GNAT family N-acetyltransferase [uncultured Sphingomonas sp.]
MLIEPADAFASRIDHPAGYCLAARRAGELIGYLLAHGWPRGSPPAVGTILDPGAAREVLFLHDLALAPAARGLRVGERLVAAALGAAHRDGLTEAELIAVEGAAAYWHRLGFAEAAMAPTLAAKVAGYGDAARWMRLAS